MIHMEFLILCLLGLFAILIAIGMAWVYWSLIMEPLLRLAWYILGILFSERSEKGDTDL